MTTRLAGSGRVTTDMSEAARILFCWHFCWHSRVEDFQILAAHAVQIGGEGRNRTVVGLNPGYLLYFLTTLGHGLHRAFIGR